MEHDFSDMLAALQKNVVHVKVLRIKVNLQPLDPLGQMVQLADESCFEPLRGHPALIMPS
eukprot:2785033-Rhodomonas_salina.1